MGAFTGRMAKIRPLLGEAVALLGNHSSGNYLPVGTTISRAAYPDLSNAYPSVYALQVAANITMPGTQYWSGIAYNGSNLYVMVAGQPACSGTLTYTSPTGAATNNVYTSTDGVTWTTQTAALPASQLWSGVAYGNGVFVAVSYTAGTAFAYSSDGITWYASTASLSSQYTAIAYGNGIFVAYPGIGSTKYCTSPDGINWTTRTWNVNSQGTSGFSGFVNDRFFRIFNGTYIHSSTDGINWGGTGPVSESVGQIVWAGDRFIFPCQVSNAAGKFKQSFDGVTWTTCPGYTGHLRQAALAYVNGWLFCFTDYGNQDAYYSTNNGSTWTWFSMAGVSTYIFAHIINARNRLTVCDYNRGMAFEIYPGYQDNLTLTGPAGYYVRVK